MERPRANYNLNMEQYYGCSCVEGGGLGGGPLHEPGNGAGQEVLVAEADVARHGRVSLPEALRHALQLRADVDKAVQLDARSGATYAEALHQRLSELGAQVVSHLCQGLVQLCAVDGPGAVSIILLKQRPPSLHEVPQGRETEHVHAA